jgi:hypothetical protein
LLTGGKVSAPETPGTPGTPQSSTLASLVAQLNALYGDAQAKLKQGDLGGYQKDIDAMGPVIQQIQQLGERPAATPSPGA